MFIASIMVEDLEESPAAYEVSDPSWNAVETAIRRMDGTQRSTVILDAPGGGFMGIGGGEDGVYVCFVVDGEGAEIRLIGSTNGSDGTIAVYMGQPNIRSKREAVDLDTVLAVAKTYAETGGLNPMYEWDRP